MSLRSSSVLVGRQRRLAVGAASALVIAGILGAGGVAEASPPSGLVNFSAASLFPKFRPNVRDYVVRCKDAPVTVQVHASGGWEAAIGNEPYRGGDFSEVVPLGTGRAFVVGARQVGHSTTYRYHVRCLPNDFTTYSFTRSGPVSPKYFSVDQDFGTPWAKRYAIIFDSHGVPVWWYHAPLRDPRVLPGGNVLWYDRRPQKWEIHHLDGRLVRTLDAVGQSADPHDLQLLPNGDYLTGSYVGQSHVDTSAYGGSSDADVANAELQEVSPGGNLLWDWKSQDHISLAETGRFWEWAINHPYPQGYDIAHWNSSEPDGGSVIASFRHFDAVYKIDKSTGRIVWKLGGTKTQESLTVKGDPRRYTLGAQHDARLLSDGTLTVFDDRTTLGNNQPRAVRFRIDEANGTATLLQSITDPDVPLSYCCGSARRLANGDWLIGWGVPGPIGGYRPNGQRTFLLRFHSGWTYRAEPVPSTAVTAPDLRQAMDAMYPAR